MADNTLNFDLDAPAVPTLTLDPTSFRARSTVISLCKLISHSSTTSDSSESIGIRMSISGFLFSPASRILRIWLMRDVAMNFTPLSS